MNRIIGNLPGLLAAAMLLVQVPVCPCSGASHSLGSPQPSSEGCHCVCPEPCHCVWENSRAAIIADTVTADSMDRQSLHRLDDTWALQQALPVSPQGLGHHVSSAVSVMDAGIFAGGNPCALFSRWLF